jgi:hypothetical protein
MFGIGISKHKTAIIQLVTPLCDAFVTQMDEVRSVMKIDESKWNSYEAIAFALWTIAHAVHNLNLGPRQTTRLQASLNETVNAYIAYKLLSSDAVATMGQDAVKEMFEETIWHMTQRAYEYNDAFNRDKVRALDPAIPDWDSSRNIVERLFSNLAKDEPLGRMTDGARYIISNLVQQTMQRSLRELGVSF